MLELFGRQLRKPSGNWGKIVAIIMNKRNTKFYSELINILDVKDNDKVFEIGYGPGLGIQMLADTNENCTIEGMDFSELMFREATKRNKKYISRNKVRLSFGDFLSEDFVNKTYDKIYCVNVIYFWNELSIVFDKIASLLNKGGIFCIFMTHEKELQNKKFTQDFCRYSIETVEEELSKAGFSNIDFKFENGYFITAIK